jgi:hypothetical protein
MELPKIEQEETPKGKRSVRRNIYGNLNGYVSGKFWTTFGDAFDKINQEDADAWLRGETK